MTAGAGCTPFNTNSVDCPFASISTVDINVGEGTNSVTIQYTQTGDTINVNGGSGPDSLSFGAGNLNGYATVNFNNLGGNNSVLVNDAVVSTPQTWMLSPGVVRRSGVAILTSTGPGSLELWGGSGDDTINVGSTPSVFSTRVQGGSGNDSVFVAAAGLGGTGDLRIDGSDDLGAPGDSLTVYTGGLTVGDNDTGTITVAGRQPILYSNVEQRSIAASTDVDNDGCPDLREGMADHIVGGQRNPLDVWDFYDVTGDGFIEISDTLTILGKFGLGENDQSYVDLYDRVAGPQTAYWQTAEATGLDVGITLNDALASLRSFGDDCISTSF